MVDVEEERVKGNRMKQGKSEMKDIGKGDKDDGCRGGESEGNRIKRGKDEIKD